MADVLTDFIIKPSAPFAAGVILFGVVWGFFKGVESVVTDDTKLEIAVWLLDIQTARKVDPWAKSFLKQFELVFGTKHLSIKCFLRSAVASLVCLLLTSAFILTETPLRIYDATNKGLGPVLSPWMTMFFGGVAKKQLEWAPLMLLCTLILPDYISLFETRLTLRLMTKWPSRFLLLACLCVDAAITGYTAMVASTVGNKFSELTFIDGWPGGLLEIFSLPGLTLDVLHMPLRVLVGQLHSSPFGQPFIRLLFYPGLFSLMWLWLYSGSGFLLKFAGRFDKFFEWFNRKFDVEKKPLSVIGLVAGALVAVVYWGAVIVSRIV
jgi:hypothetical protein